MVYVQHMTDHFEYSYRYRGTYLVIMETFVMLILLSSGLFILFANFENLLFDLVHGFFFPNKMEFSNMF